MRQDISELPASVQRRIKALKKQPRRKSVIVFKPTDNVTGRDAARKRFEEYVRNSAKSEKRAVNTNFIIGRLEDDS